MDNVSAEFQDVHNYLNAVYVAVSEDVKIIPNQDDPYVKYAAAHHMSFEEYTKLRYRSLLSDRVTELRKAIASSPTVAKILGTPDNSRIASMLGRFFRMTKLPRPKRSSEMP
jgi:hypothetical protein